MPTPAPQVNPVTIAQLQSLLSVIYSAVVVSIALGLGWIFLPRAVLSSRLVLATRRARAAEGALSDVSAGLEALTSQVAALRADVTQMRKTLVVSTRYNAQLVLFIRSRKPVGEMPPPPDEISDDVLAAIRAHELAQEAAVQGAAGVVTPVAAL